MHFCNECDKSFSRKDNLVRHHHTRHPNSGTLPSLLRNLSNSTVATNESYEPKAKRAKAMDDSDDKDDESETDDGSVAPASSTEDEAETDRDDGSNATEDIEEDLNDEDEDTPSLSSLRNVWELIGEEAARENDGDVICTYIDLVRFARKLKDDPVHQKVLETMESLQERDLNMDFDEALIKAAYRRKHIIRQAAADAMEDENSNDEIEQPGNASARY